jgi:hypothetical protein
MLNFVKNFLFITPLSCISHTTVFEIKRVSIFTTFNFYSWNIMKQKKGIKDVDDLSYILYVCAPPSEMCRMSEINAAN